MFFKTPQRNFEWFEITFTKKIQTIINENKEDNFSWVRDLFVSLFIAILSLLLQIIDAGRQSRILHAYLTWGTIVLLVLLAIWFIYCVVRYNKKLKTIKTRIVPQSIKNFYSISESVQLFDNDICNDIILSQSYIDLALSVAKPSFKEFYLLESLHYYYKSIRIFNAICSSHDLEELFTTESGSIKKINVIRLQNYLELIKAIEIDEKSFDSDTIKHVQEFRKSFDIVNESFEQTLVLLKEKNFLKI